MAKFDDHITQAKRNLTFLSAINTSIKDCYDWQVTVCFYAALHLVNAHLSKYNQQFRKRRDVNLALNFENVSPARIPEDEYISYIALQSLSRRSRYLVSEKDGNLTSTNAALTYDKHLTRSLRHLDKLIIYFSKLFDIRLDSIEIKCIELKDGELHHFKKIG